MRTATFLLLTSALWGCDKSTIYTVAGTELKVVDTSYRALAPGYFCEKLDVRGQYMLVISDFAVCEQILPDAGSRSIFHGLSNTNLRIIFPSTGLCKFANNEPCKSTQPSAPVNRFTIGRTTCKDTPSGIFEALAVFSHHTEGSADYDLSLIAESGTVTIHFPESPTADIQGSFDLNFGGENIKGEYTAHQCLGIAPEQGACPAAPTCLRFGD